MRIGTSYKSILSLSFPIMVGSAAQNLITLTDSIFLYHYRELEFATMGVVSVFYLLILAIGFGFSRGGQILIARNYGAGTPTDVGRVFRAVLTFEMVLALVLFLFLQYGSAWFLSWFINDPQIAARSYDYLYYRSMGLFFSFGGVSVIALYSGLARTWFITVDTAILAFCNIFLNYSLIFGKWGFPEMGIAGAGLASTISEGIALLIFILYMIWDKKIKPYKLLKRTPLVWKQLIRIYKTSVSLVLLSSMGLLSWFIFFSIIENIGQRPLAISNLVRIVYLVLTIPIWGLSSGINTLASQMVGRRKRHAVLAIVWKTTRLTLMLSILLCLPIVLFPETVLSPLFQADQEGLLAEAVPILRLLIVILFFFSLGSIYFNGVIGIGENRRALIMQALVTLVYLIYVYAIVNWLNASLLWVWTGEILYWILIFILSFAFLRRRWWLGKSHDY